MQKITHSWNRLINPLCPEYGTVGINGLMQDVHPRRHLLPQSKSWISGLWKRDGLWVMPLGWREFPRFRGRGVVCLKGVRADVMSATPGWFAVLVVIGFPMGLLTDLALSGDWKYTDIGLCKSYADQPSPLHANKFKWLLLLLHLLPLILFLFIELYV